MTRRFSIFACTLALTLIPPIGFDLGAAAKPKAMMCKATGWTGKQSTWKCKAGQKCCFDWFNNKGACVAASSICI